MAINIATLTAKLAADTSDFSRKMKSAERDLSSFADGAKQVGSAARDLGSTMTKKVTAPIVGLGAVVAATAGRFEASMNRVGALTQETGERFVAMESMAKELGSTTMFSASQAADGMSFLAQAGFGANEVIESMPGMLDLAAAGQLDLARAADIASNVLTGFNLTAAEANRVSDLLAAVSIKTNTNVEQLGEAMKFVAPVAASAGFEIEETAAAVGLLGNAGIQGSMAGTTLRNVIVKLLKPTSEAAGVINRLGLNLKDNEGNLVSFTEIVAELERAGASTADMMTIFGVRGGPGLAALVAQGSDALGTMNEEMLNAGGTAAEVASRQMEGLNGAILLLKSATEGLAIAIADSGLLDFLTGVVEKAAALASRLSETNPAILRVAVVFAGVVAAAGPVIWVLGSIASAAASLASVAGVLSISLGAVATAAGGLVAVGVVGAAVGALADRFINLNLEVEDAKEALLDFYELGERTPDFDLLTGGGLDNLSEEMLNLKGTTAGTLDVLGQFGANFLSLLPFAEVEGPMDQAAERLQIFDEVLSSMVRDGDLEQAGFYLSRLADEASEAGMPLDDLIDQFPELGREVRASGGTLTYFFEALDLGIDPVVAMEKGLDDVGFAAARQDRELGGLVAGSLPRAIGGAHEHADALSAEERAQEDVIESLQRYQDELRASSDPLFALMDSEAAYAAALAEREEVMNDATSSAEDLRQADLNAAQAAIALKEDTAALIEGIVTGTVSVDDLKDTLHLLARDAPDAFLSVVTAAEDHIGDIPGLFKTVGIDIMKGIELGLISEKQAMIATLTNGINDAKAAAELAARIRSPSGLFRDDVGAPIGQGITVGIESTGDEMQRRVRGLIEAAADESVRAAGAFDIGRSMRRATPMPAGGPGGSPEGGAVTGVGGGGVSTANIVVELDGRTLMQAIGRPLVEEIRLRGAVRTV